MKSPDLIGQKFGKLTVVVKLSKNKHGEMTWLCKCDCGKERTATSNKLTHGYTISCNSCRYKRVAEKNKQRGHKPIRLWNIYNHMIKRCYDIKEAMFYRYGGRGIKVCDEWKESFIHFRTWALENGYSDNLSIDRIDNDGNYSPENCRWTTGEVQANNRSTNLLITYNGVTDTLANWSKRTGIKSGTIQSRLYHGWPTEKLFIPITRKARNT